VEEEAMSAVDVRLEPWLRLADELQAFDEFMHRTSPALFEIRKSSSGRPFDAGTTAANRMRAVIANRWSWYGWKQDSLKGIVDMELRTFNRWIDDAGGEAAFQAKASDREMLRRIAHLETEFKRLVDASQSAV
jgi:hypothetical protein